MGQFTILENDYSIQVEYSGGEIHVVISQGDCELGRSFDADDIDEMMESVSRIRASLRAGYTLKDIINEGKQYKAELN